MSSYQISYYEKYSDSMKEELDEQLTRENNGSGSPSVTAAQFRQEHMMSAKSAAASHENANGTYSTREIFPASTPVAAGAISQTMSRGDFWNLMTLAK
jgi:hypothetical protein